MNVVICQKSISNISIYCYAYRYISTYYICKLVLFFSMTFGTYLLLPTFFFAFFQIFLFFCIVALWVSMYFFLIFVTYCLFLNSNSSPLIEQKVRIVYTHKNNNKKKMSCCSKHLSHYGKIHKNVGIFFQNKT